MAKDPATLWYWNDWNGGTMTMSRQAKGAYMDILSAQFNSGHLTETQIKTLLGQDQGLWATVLREKFLVDGGGRYYNERLDIEIEKRRAFSSKQSENGKKGGRPKKAKNNPTLNPNESLLENEIEDERKGGVGEKWNQRPGEDELGLALPEIKSGAVIQLFAISKNTNIDHKKVNGLWMIFKQQHFTGEKYYQSPNEAFSHFINWCQGKKIEDFKPQRKEPMQVYKDIT